MRTRAALAAAFSVTLVTIGFGLAGCSGDSSALPPALQATPSGWAPSAAAAAPADNSCNPRASLRPSGALPAAGQTR